LLVEHHVRRWQLGKLQSRAGSLASWLCLHAAGALQVIDELNTRTQLLQKLHQQSGAAAAEQSRLVKAEIQQRVVELRRLGVTAGEA
jgi:hypothetical protein